MNKPQAHEQSERVISTPNEYIANVLKTESVNMDAITGRLSGKKEIRLLHGAIGVITEGGELQDALKKHLFYGKSLDEVNLKEEIGDVLWYVAVMLDALGSSFEEVMNTNILKLRARYGEKFSETKAITRDLDTERKILES